MSNILVTVVMGVYNQHNTAELEEAVQSILAQSMREWELIICDDGSEGEAARNLKNYENRDPRIRVIRHSENKGLAATLNTCIAQAKGKYIADRSGWNGSISFWKNTSNMLLQDAMRI